jgi:tetratricopeptide (TPR) repeat protein
VSGRTWLLTAAVAWAFVAGPATADKKPPGKEAISFGQLQSPTADVARAQALDWLKSTGKTDADSLKAFEAIWAQTDRSLLERVTDTLALGDAEAAKALAEARDASQPAPTAVPAVLKDAKKPAFFRSNFALAYAKALTKRRVYEEALEALKAAKPEQVVDPSGYLFHRAVAEHALLQKDEAIRSIARLLDDGADAPDRYRLVGMLMAVDMQGWKEKDLGNIGRLMDNVERRLDLARDGPETQKTQKQIVARLDELIKELENQAKGSSQPNGGS